MKLPSFFTNESWKTTGLVNPDGTIGPDRVTDLTPVEVFGANIVIRQHDGLTIDEGRVMDALTEAVAAFDQLEEQHPNDTHEFYEKIHVAQDLLAVRIARRLYPEGWPTHG